MPRPPAATINATGRYVTFVFRRHKSRFNRAICIRNFPPRHVRRSGVALLPNHGSAPSRTGFQPVAFISLVKIERAQPES